MARRNKSAFAALTFSLGLALGLGRASAQDAWGPYYISPQQLAGGVAAGAGYAWQGAGWLGSTAVNAWNSIWNSPTGTYDPGYDLPYTSSFNSLSGSYGSFPSGYYEDYGTGVEFPTYPAGLPYLGGGGVYGGDLGPEGGW